MTRGAVGLLARILPLYVGFGAIMGTVQGGLPPLLRDRGLEISTLGWIYALYLPFGVAFLWAHLVDRWHLPWLGHWRGWIVCMQALACLALLAIACGKSAPIFILAGLGFLVTIAIATMDLALDALAVEGVPTESRGLAASGKLAALAVGAMLGNGVFLLLYASFGWQLAFLSLSLFLAFLTLPVLGAEESGREHVSRASLLSTLLDREHQLRLCLLTLICCVIFPLAGLNRIMLIDIGVPLAEIGRTVGLFGPLAMLGASLIAAPLMQRFGASVAIMLFGLLGAASIGLLLWGCQGHAQGPALLGAVLIGAAVSGVYVALASRILGWSKGAQPATDYAAYYGLSRFASTFATIAATQLVGPLGWTTLYIVGLLAFAGSIFLTINILFRRTP